MEAEKFEVEQILKKRSLKNKVSFDDNCCSTLLYSLYLLLIKTN